MLAIVAAILFGLALILDLANVNMGETLTTGVLVTAGLLCVALHMAGVGAGARRLSWRARR